MSDIAAKDMLFSLRGKAKDVVYVLGNHEHYYGAFGVTKEIAADVCKEVGVRLLDASTVTIGGRRFVGATLWFKRDEQARRHRHAMMDFQLIEEFEEAVYDENSRDIGFFEREARTGNIVISHHLPSYRSVAPEFRTGPGAMLNPFFVCDCEEIMKRREPAIWIHGHTHVAFDYFLGRTRVICNPIGYPRQGGEKRVGFYVDV